jgi:hypothetical protein
MDVEFSLNSVDVVAASVRFSAATLLSLLNSWQALHCRRRAA